LGRGKAGEEKGGILRGGGKSHEGRKKAKRARDEPTNKVRKGFKQRGPRRCPWKAGQTKEKEKNAAERC